MIIETLDDTKKKIERRFKRNPNTRLSSLFNEIRREVRTDLYGDFPLAVEVARGAHNVNALTWRKLNKLCKQIPEYNERTRGEKSKFYNALELCSTGNILEVNDGSHTTIYSILKGVKPKK